MKVKDIIVGQEYAARRGSYTACQRVRVLEAAKVVPSRAPTVWSKHLPVVLPGEADYARLEGKAKLHFRCEGVEGADLDYLGDQAAWEPLVDRLITAGLLLSWERHLPDRDALNLTVSREQAARVLAALERGE